MYNSAEKEVGFVPQIVEPVFEGYYTDSNQLWNIHFQRIEANTIIPKGHLHKKAKLTDIMSVSFLNGQLFFSDKMLSILEASHYKCIQFVKTEIITKTGERIKSNILHPFEADYNFIDTLDSEFWYTNSMLDKLLEQVRFNTGNDYLNAKINNRKEIAKNETMDYKPLIIRKINFNDDMEIDLFSVSGVLFGGIGFYVSQRLKDKILEEKCTGFIFREINEAYP